MKNEECYNWHMQCLNIVYKTNLVPAWDTSTVELKLEACHDHFTFYVAHKINQLKGSTVPLLRKRKTERHSISVHFLCSSTHGKVPFGLSSKLPPATSL